MVSQKDGRTAMRVPNGTTSNLIDATLYEGFSNFLATFGFNFFNVFFPVYFMLIFIII